MRKNYLDNIRILCICVLIPYHCAMAFNAFNEPNYIFFTESKLATSFVLFFSPWFMPILFTISGISAKYSLEKRGFKHFFLERVKKVLIPFFAGIFTVCPFLAYVADRFHNHYSGTFFEHYKIFFSKVTDFTGYDGFFTPGHLWFLMFLCVALIFCFPIILLQKKFFPSFSCKKISVLGIVLLGIPAFLCHFVLDFDGKSMGYCSVLFLLGYYVFSEDSVEEVLKKYKVWLFSFAMLLTIVRYCFCAFFQNSFPVLHYVLHQLIMWFMQLGVLAVFAECFNGTNKALNYLNRTSFVFYILHFPILLVCQLAFYDLTGEYVLSSALSIVLTYACTFALSEIVKRIPVINFLFGIKNAH